MTYTTKYFQDHSKKLSTEYDIAYELDSHIISISSCDRCARKQYYFVCVDGVTVSTRSLKSNAIRIALKFLNEKNG